MQGVGVLVGPILGAILFSIGDYKAPFMFFAVIYILFIPTVASIHNKLKAEFIDLIESQPNTFERNESVSLIS